jgi:hypothetical protein
VKAPFLAFRSWQGQREERDLQGYDTLYLTFAGAEQSGNWIPIRRGFCNRCEKTFTFLPPFSPPYCHYSLIARSQALRRYFPEGHPWEAAAPAVKDPDRVSDPSTLRRWFRSLDSSRPPFSFLRDMVRAVNERLGGAETLLHESLTLRWQTVFPFLMRFWPLRL